MEELKYYICGCGAKFTQRQNLHRHRLSCIKCNAFTVFLLAHAKIKILEQYCGLQIVLIPLSRLLYLILEFLID